MASVGNSSWSNILSQKTDTFQQQGFALIISEIKNESSFRKFFETTCLRIQEYKSVSLLNTLLPSFHNVKEFTGLINGVRDGDRPGKLMEIIWGGTCAVIQSASDEKLLLGTREGLVQKLSDFNNRIPSFGDDRSPLVIDEQVEQGMKNVFCIYIDCLLFLINYHRARSPSEAWHNHFNDTTTQINTIKEVFDNTSQKLEQANSALKWEYRRHLGDGSFGAVAVVEHSPSGIKVARKKIPLFRYNLKESRLQDVRTEAKIMSKLRSHLHITTIVSFYENEEDFFILMLPIGNCSLKDLFNRSSETILQEQQRHLLYSSFGCLLSALSFAHGQNIRHKDIKPGNIIISGQNMLLTDFGISFDFSDAESSKTEGTPKGTLSYRAPELVCGQGRGRKADVYSLGCVFSEMLTVAKSKNCDEYRKARQFETSEGEISYAFRYRPDVVERWVRTLKGSEIDNLLTTIILDMVEPDKSKRTTSEAAHELLEKQKEIRCDCLLQASSSIEK